MPNQIDLASTLQPKRKPKPKPGLLQRAYEAARPAYGALRDVLSSPPASMQDAYTRGVSPMYGAIREATKPGPGQVGLEQRVPLPALNIPVPEMGQAYNRTFAPKSNWTPRPSEPPADAVPAAPPMRPPGTQFHRDMAAVLDAAPEGQVAQPREGAYMRQRWGDGADQSPSGLAGLLDQDLVQEQRAKRDIIRQQADSDWDASFDPARERGRAQARTEAGVRELDPQDVLPDEVNQVRQQVGGDLGVQKFGQGYNVQSRGSGGMGLLMGGAGMAEKLSPTPEARQQPELLNQSMYGGKRVEGSLLDSLDPEQRAQVMRSGQDKTRLALLEGQAGLSDEQIGKQVDRRASLEARQAAVRERGLAQGKQLQERMDARKLAQTPGGLASRLMGGDAGQGGIDPILRMAAMQGNPAAMQSIGRIAEAQVQGGTAKEIATLETSVARDVGMGNVENGREQIKAYERMSDADRQAEMDRLQATIKSNEGLAKDSSEERRALKAAEFAHQKAAQESQQKHEAEQGDLGRKLAIDTQRRDIGFKQKELKARIAANQPLQEAEIAKITAEGKLTEAQADALRKMDPDEQMMVQSIWADPNKTTADKLRETEGIKSAKASGVDIADTLGGLRTDAERTGSGWKHTLREDIDNVWGAPNMSPAEKVAKLKAKGWTDEQMSEFMRTYRGKFFDLPMVSEIFGVHPTQQLRRMLEGDKPPSLKGVTLMGQTIKERQP